MFMDTTKEKISTLQLNATAEGIGTGHGLRRFGCYVSIIHALHVKCNTLCAQTPDNVVRIWEQMFAFCRLRAYNRYMSLQFLES